MLTPKDRLIVALDFTTQSPALAMAKQLKGLVRTMKIGSVLFTACGPEIIRRVRRLGFEVMLDLKFHDIPSTVGLSCRAAVQHRVALLTVHTSGEQRMLEAAVAAVRSESRLRNIHRPLVLGVTVLTSVGAKQQGSVQSRILSLSYSAQKAGCDGVVASAQEAKALRRRFKNRLRIVCPGIRPSWASAGDQKRICTPADALARGADWLVIGRPITTAPNPRLAAERILNEMEGS